MGTNPSVIDSRDYHVIFFDGVCNLCNGFVNFVIDRDKKQKFRFASLQSDVAEELLASFPGIVTGANPESVVLLSPDNDVFTQSTAVLKIGQQLGGIWKLSGVLYVFPRRFRDWVYRWVARNRYRWFGKQDVCRMPTPELKARFIE